MRWLNRVMVNQGSTPTSLGAKTLAQHPHDFIELFACQVAIWPGERMTLKRSSSCQSSVAAQATICWASTSSGFWGISNRIQFATANAAQHGGAFN
jgi:hypothetical protein